MNHREAAASVRNALQFLGPLTALADAMDHAAKTEQFLAEAVPTARRLQQEHAAVQEKVDRATAARQDEEDRLAALLKTGKADLEARIRDIEVELGAKLSAAITGHNFKVKVLEERRETRERICEALDVRVRELTGVKATLEDQIAGLRRDLASIAKRAEGAS